MATVAEELLTAEAYSLMPDPGYSTELIQGRIVEMPQPGGRHGQICARIVRLIGPFVEDQELGHVLSNDSGVITERGPDSVRGADVSFYRFEKLPKGPLPPGYPTVSPDLIFEVISPSDRWTNLLVKISEYLSAGVGVVCVVDPRSSMMSLYRTEATLEVFGGDDSWSIPEILPGLSIPVRRFFD